ncbi:MAG: hypothetical protein ACI841_003908 [Planctomycetota bacterium]|jgi:hypothetical protein
MYRKLISLAVLTALVVPATAQVQDMSISKVGGTGSGDFTYHGTANGFRAYAFATTSCNEGTVSLQWTSPGQVHIGQNMFKIADGRVIQLGYSWLKLGFCAVNEFSCGSCQSTSCATLGVGCADTYGSGLNDGAGGHGKHDINPTNAEFIAGASNPSGSATIRGRLQVPATEMGESGATYIAEAQYCYRQDHHAGNGRNNVSWRQINTTTGSGSVNGTGFAIRRYECAIEAWQEVQPSVTVVEVVNDQEPGAVADSKGFIVVGYDAINLGGGLFRYEYAVQNLTSHQAVRTFELPLGCGVNITNLYYHDVNHHSGTPYTNIDWVSTVTASSIKWEGPTFATNANANAIHWGELFNFGFTADAPPAGTQATMATFLPGSLSQLTAPVEGPCGTAVCGLYNYCTTSPNSSGSGAVMAATGSSSVSTNTLSLGVVGSAPGQFGLFFYGPTQTSIPFGDGTLCVTGGVNRLNPPQGTNVFGDSFRALDFTSAPMNSGPGAIVPGSSWNFQWWYRDPAAANTGFNQSDAVNAVFCP